MMGGVNFPITHPVSLLSAFRERASGSESGKVPENIGLTFGGPCYDVEHRMWSLAHVVENDGAIPHPSDDILSLGNDGKLMNPADAAIGSIGETGLATGKIYFNREYATMHAMSGFFVEKRFFLTCAHFEPTDRAKQAGFIDGRISSCRLSEFGDDQWIRHARLVYYNPRFDIALFVILDGSHDARNYIRWEQMRPITSMITPARIFSIGYNGGHESVFDMYTKGYLDSLPPETRSRLLRQGNSHPPAFERMFLPNQRAIAAGCLLADEPTNINEYQHTISGWFSISGSMVGVMTEGHIAIIGVFSGGNTSKPSNKLRGFSDDILTELESEMKACQQKHN